MKYEIVVKPKAKKQLLELPKKARDKVRQGITALGDDPRPTGCKKLAGQDAYRIRVGDYRVIYEIEDKKLLVTVIKVGHRSDIYD